jgi:hypothetical protein
MPDSFRRVVSAGLVADMDKRLAAMTPQEREAFMRWFINAGPR